MGVTIKMKDNSGGTKKATISDAGSMGRGSRSPNNALVRGKRRMSNSPTARKLNAAKRAANKARTEENKRAAQERAAKN